MTPLTPAYISVLRVRAAALAFILLAAAIVADIVLAGRTQAPLGIVTVAALAVGGIMLLVFPRRRHRSWSYLEEADELHIQHGLWTRNAIVVPFGRVQHIDISQGPIERRFGVGRLILYTAGTRHSAVALPGLNHEEAGRMRDRIRAKIRQDMV
jgi:membrane protein YdbS with pleckstrin-like domain